MTKRLAADTCLAKRLRLINHWFDSGPTLLVCRAKWQLLLPTAVGLREHRQEHTCSSSQPPPTLTLALRFYCGFHYIFWQHCPSPSLAQILPTLPCFFCPLSILSHIMFPNSQGLDRAPLCCGRHANGYLRWNNQEGKDPLSHFTWPRNFTYVICTHMWWRACLQSCDYYSIFRQTQTRHWGQGQRWEKAQNLTEWDKRGKKKEW